MTPLTFQQNLLVWFDQHGRKDLPWQQDISPYRVWLSETMLQQTQVATVIPYFLAFTAKFPNVESLAQATVDDVLQLWSGLGYYARARNLHKAAQNIYELSQFPDTLDGLLALPGIGQSTAGAILSIAFNKPQPILDGNVKRVLARFRAIPGWAGSSEANKQLWSLSAAFTPDERIADYTQAIMDLGATVCTRNNPACKRCPLTTGCAAFLTNRIQDFPAPKKAKALPIKQVIFLFVTNRQQVLLEKRPPTGIWGGLWSLPEFHDEAAALNWCLVNNIQIRDKQAGEKQRHTFSHFHLDYTPLFIETDSAMDVIRETASNVWQNTQQISQLGLPTPIKLLLQQHLKGE